MVQEFRSELLNGGHCLTEADGFLAESVRTFFRDLGAQTIENYISKNEVNQSINKLYLNVERPPSQGEISLTNMGTF